MGSTVETRAVSAGDERVDAMARQREAAHAPALQARACDGCGGATGEKDFTVCSWSYYFSKLGAMSVLAALLGKVLVLTRVVRHATHHWICPACAKRVRAARMKAGALRFVGLFLSAVGLIATMALLSALFLLPLSPRDRSTAQGWAWAPPSLLVAGAALCLLARAVRLPPPLAALDVRPFTLYLSARIDPANYDVLRRDCPDLFGDAQRPGWKPSWPAGVARP